jgi:hypothetical protein
MPIMAIGQPSGPPASYRQVQDLLGLLQEAGHTDFRDARGPMHFTQRQAGGKFTRDEADGEPAPEPTPAPRAARLSSAEQALRKFSDSQLAAELQRRGWIVVEP